jgi:hypothetical protein
MEVVRLNCSVSEPGLYAWMLIRWSSEPEARRRPDLDQLADSQLVLMVVLVEADKEPVHTSEHSHIHCGPPTRSQCQDGPPSAGRHRCPEHLCRFGGSGRLLAAAGDRTRYASSRGQTGLASLEGCGKLQRSSGKVAARQTAELRASHARRGAGKVESVRRESLKMRAHGGETCTHCGAFAKSWGWCVGQRAPLVVSLRKPLRGMTMDCTPHRHV